jgi:anthranilate synthase/aminodeoxychorismate synthase-like glutamine amidotransferase
MKNILMIDNYDSFTYNLVQYLGELGADVTVKRNDKIDIAGIRALAPDAIVVSPGPCTPKEAGISLAVFHELAGELPILGVCLGEQCMGEAFGGRVDRAPRLMHGKTSPVIHDGRSIFAGLPNPFRGDALSFADRRCELASRMPRNQRTHCGGRGDGPAPQNDGGRGRAVSSRIDWHAGRKTSAE